MLTMTAKQTADMERRAQEAGVSMFDLMQKAGAAAANMVMRDHVQEGGQILVLCGKGNNGGDGMVAAKLLADLGYHVTVALLLGEPAAKEACKAYELLKESKAEIIKPPVDLSEYKIKLVIDAVFGFNFRGVLPREIEDLFVHINSLKIPVLSLDLPSGVLCDTGETAKGAVIASKTIAFSAYKPAHVTPPASDYCGDITLVDIGIPFAYKGVIPQPVTEEQVYAMFRKRRQDSGKWDYGTAMLVCGSRNITGAAVLSVGAAAKSGAGLVMLASVQEARRCAMNRYAEPVYVPLGETTEGHVDDFSFYSIFNRLNLCTAMLIGCGTGISDSVGNLTRRLIQKSPVPLIIDADGINCIAPDISILQQAKSPVILTPHIREMSRLTGVDTQVIQSDRIGYAADFAAQNGVVLVLKGHGTVIACPDGEVLINQTGNPGMAKGGSGDVLAGMMVSLLAQGMTPEDAAVSAVHLHGAAGDLAAELLSQQAMLPTDIIDCLPQIFLRLEQHIT